MASRWPAAKREAKANDILPLTNWSMANGHDDPDSLWESGATGSRGADFFLEAAGRCPPRKSKHRERRADAIRPWWLLADLGKDGKPEAVIPKVSQETLAEMIGTTRSRVSFFMNKFRKLGFIEYNGGLSVHSSLLNVVLHD